MTRFKSVPVFGGLFALTLLAFAPQAVWAQSSTNKVIYPYISGQAGIVRTEFDSGGAAAASEKGYTIGINGGVDFFLVPEAGLTIGIDLGYSYSDEMEFKGLGLGTTNVGIVTLGGTFAVAPFPARNVRLLAGVGIGFWDVDASFLGDGTGENLYYNFGLDTVVAKGLRLVGKYNLQEIDTGAGFNLDVDGVTFGLKYYY